MNVFLYYRTYWGRNSLTGWLGRNIIAKSKMEMVRACLKSMEFNKLDPRVKINKIACVDNSTPEYTEHLTKYFDEIYHTNEGLDVTDTRNGWVPLWGMRGGLVKVLEFINQRQHDPEDIILILEDDYVFAPNGFSSWINACEHFSGFVTPYDHPYNYYRNDMFQKLVGIDVFEGRHWRETTCTTSVIGAKYEFFKKTRFIRKIPRLVFGPFYVERFFRKELPSLDIIFYRRIRKLLGVKTYSPMPGLAQHLSIWPNVSPRHMKKNYDTPSTELSPGVDWIGRCKSLIESI